MMNLKIPTPRTTESRPAGGRRLTSEFRHRPKNKPNLFKPQMSLIYMDIEAVVDSEIIKVWSIIPEQYTLKKLLIMLGKY